MLSASAKLGRQSRAIQAIRQSQHTSFSTQHIATRKGARIPRSRFQSTSTGPSGTNTSPGANFTNSHVIAGLVGGGVTLAGVYGWYHYSGLKTVVDTSHSIQLSMKKAAQSAADKLPDSPNEVIKYLRSVAKSYAGLIPGGAESVDQSFDTIEELRRTHGEQVDKIIKQTYDDIKKTIQSGKMDAKTATKVYEILRDQGSKLAEVAKEAGTDVLDKHPELKEKIGGSWEELQRLTKEAGDSDVGKRARQISEETSKAISDIFQKGLSAESITKAKDLVETKSKEIKELTEKAAKQAWNKGMEEYGDKLPDSVKSILSKDNMSALVAGGGASATATVFAVWNRVKEMASKKGGFDEKNIEEFKRFVEDKVKQTKGKSSVGLDAAWSTARSWLGSVPGGQKALEQVGDIDVSELTKLAQSRGSDAEELLQETYGDILKVLKEKSEKAKKLAGETKKEAKEKS